jgi:hypothetical protein
VVNGGSPRMTSRFSAFQLVLSMVLTSNERLMTEFCLLARQPDVRSRHMKHLPMPNGSQTLRTKNFDNPGKAKRRKGLRCPSATVIGTIPTWPRWRPFAWVAQSVEQRTRNAQVVGSNPTSGSKTCSPFGPSSGKTPRRPVVSAGMSFTLGRSARRHRERPGPCVLTLNSGPYDEEGDRSMSWLVDCAR